MKQIPFLLIYSRIVIGIAIGLIALVKPDHYNIIIVTLLLTGVITDIFDGIIARSYGVDSEKLRVWDSNVDVFFWLISIASIFMTSLEFIKLPSFLISLVISLEVFAYCVCFIKFKKPIATHTYLAKLWSITLLAFLIDLTLNQNSSYFFYLCIGLGIISRLEIILILFKLDQWKIDIPSLFSKKIIQS